MYIAAWDEWNIDHISKHNVTPEEAEYVMDNAKAPWPIEKGDRKFVVWVPTESGRLLQVIFVFKFSNEIEFDALTLDEWADLRVEDPVAYVIHAMDLTDRMKRQYRRRRII